MKKELEERKRRGEETMKRLIKWFEHELVAGDSTLPDWFVKNEQLQALLAENVKIYKENETMGNLKVRLHF